MKAEYWIFICRVQTFLVKKLSVRRSFFNSDESMSVQKITDIEPTLWSPPNGLAVFSVPKRVSKNIRSATDRQKHCVDKLSDEESCFTTLSNSNRLKKRNPPSFLFVLLKTPSNGMLNEK